jgi:mannose-6-phosphate isomerase-like protein (cupin superfamily)
MPKAVDIRAALADLPVLKNRRPETPVSKADAAFAVLAKTREGGVFAGSFEGESAWERHCNGDELVQVLEGETRLTILTDGGPTVLAMKAGMVTVVPKGHWHKFHAPKGVTVMSMTPQPTEHSTADDPTQEGVPLKS